MTYKRIVIREFVPPEVLQVTEETPLSEAGTGGGKK